MKTKRYAAAGLGILIVLSILLSGCGLEAAPAKASPVQPEAVVERFYRWYLETDNALADRAYRSSEYLTPEWVQKVDGMLDSFSMGGVDPFLCAQDRPQDWSVEVLSASGEEAQVILHQVWNPDTEYAFDREITVVLRLVAEEWKIDAILCGGSDSGIALPDQVVERFYSWYFRYILDVGNPLVDRAYRSSEYLTAELIQRVDGVQGFDPFLCAQDIPGGFSVGLAEGSAEEARVPLHTIWNPDTEYESIRDLTVVLQLVEGQWRIAEVRCTEAGAD